MRKKGVCCLVPSDEEIYTEYERELELYKKYTKEASGDTNRGRVSPKRVRETRAAWVEQANKLLSMLDGRRTSLIEVIRRVTRERGGNVRRK